jgi:tetratricopeptide (TPR) repeat protein
MIRSFTRFAFVVLAALLAVTPSFAQDEKPAQMTIPQILAAAENLRASGRVDDAVKGLEYILKAEPSNIDALRMLGDIAWDQQNAEEAQKRWMAVRKIQQNDFGANWGLGRLYLQGSSGRGSARNAILYLEVAESVLPAAEPELKPQVLLALAQAYNADGQTSRAMEKVREVLAVAPDNYEACYFLVALRLGSAQSADDFDQALSDAERLVQVVRKELEASGTTLEGAQRLATAYQMEIQVLKNSVSVVFERNPDGSLSDRLLPGKEKRAAATIAKTVDAMLRYTDLQRTLAYFQIAEVAAKAVQYDANPDTLMELGLLQKATGQSAKAVETFRKVLEIDPLHKEARRQLDALQSQEAAPSAWPGVGTP